MRRIAVFASYNKNGIIATYVVHFLKELKKEVNEIIFVADNEVSPDEEDKIKDIVTYSLCERHACYDFGSYRRGYEWADENGFLKNADELIFCNDSCYGPIYPFQEVFLKMETMDCDFWGMTESYQIRYHLQSYFLVFKRNVFSSDSFRSFVSSFEKQKDFLGYEEKCETMFTEHLLLSGFKCASFCSCESVVGSKQKESDNPCMYPVTLLSLGMPLVKREVFINKHGGILRESQKVLMNEIRKHNPALYDIIRDDSYELLLDTDDEKVNCSRISELKRKAESLNNQIDNLNNQNQELNILIADLQTQNAYYQNQIASFSQKINHRSVRLALKVEKRIDRINRILSLGKYRKDKGQIKAVESEKKLQEEPMAFISYDAWYENNQDYSRLSTDVKPIAFYLPQFHSFKENDEWWGKGFTEWTNTKKSYPRFLSHYQPREPHPDFGYYNLLDWKVLQKQAQLAKQHGIYGFCFYRYWFAGKVLMGRPIELLLNHPEIDINYCLCWANENWTRKWDGQESDILIGQTYENDSVEYIADIKKFLDDPRYIRVDNKPVIIIYRPSLLPNPSVTFRRWREWAREEGIGEILIWIQRGVASLDKSEMVDGADAEIEFPPSGCAEFDHYDITRVGGEKGSGNLIGYRKMVNNVLRKHAAVDQFMHTIYRGVTLGWDNSPRRETGFWATWGFSLVDYYRWLRYVVQDTRCRHSENQRFLFINAWNEWAEGTYLEPDKRYGYSSINVTSRAIFGLPICPHIEGFEVEKNLESDKIKAEILISQYKPLFPYPVLSMYHNIQGGSPAEIWDAFNALENPLEEIKKIRRKFISDSQSVVRLLRLKRVKLDTISPYPQLYKQQKVAVQLHLFYEDMLPFISKYLSNIPCQFDIFVSVPEHRGIDNSKVKSDLSKIDNAGKVVVRGCPNKGRDIAPFICTFGRDLLKYDIIGHFHSKKSLHSASHSHWAEFIYNHLLGTEQDIERIFNMLSGQVGMVSPPDYLIMLEPPSGWGSDLEIAQDVLDRCHIDVNLKEKFPIIEFPQGSMFWARTEYLRKLFESPFTFDDFPEEPIGQDGTIAHALERLFFVWGLGKDLETRQVFLPNEDNMMCVYR